MHRPARDPLRRLHPAPAGPASPGGLPLLHLRPAHQPPEAGVAHELRGHGRTGGQRSGTDAEGRSGSRWGSEATAGGRRGAAAADAGTGDRVRSGTDAAAGGAAGEAARLGHGGPAPRGAPPALIRPLPPERKLRSDLHCHVPASDLQRPSLHPQSAPPSSSGSRDPDEAVFFITLVKVLTAPGPVRTEDSLLPLTRPSDVTVLVS